MTRFGNRLHVVGDNPEAAAYAGISVQKTVWVTYVLCGLLSAVSGFVMVSNAGYAIYTQGNSLATLTISCCVIGGIKMAGGKGTAIHVLLGVLIMRVISQMMTALLLPQMCIRDSLYGGQVPFPAGARGWAGAGPLRPDCRHPRHRAAL